MVERIVLAVEEQVRGMLLAFEAKLGAMVAADEPIATEIPRPRHVPHQPLGGWEREDIVRAH